MEKKDFEEDEFFDLPTPTPNAGSSEVGAAEENGAKKKPNAEKIRCVIVGVVTAIAIFIVGVFAGRLFLDEELRALMKVKDRIQDSYYQDVSDERFYDVIFDAINENILDDYSLYMTETEYDASLSRKAGNQFGVGLAFTDAVGLRLERVCGNSPAERIGLSAGDLLVGIGGTEETLVPVQTCAEFNEQLKLYAANVPFYLQWQTPGGELRVAETCRADYVENYVFYRTNDSAFGFSGAEMTTLTAIGTPLSALTVDAAYIRLTSFNGAAAQAFDVAMSRFKADGKKDLVLDLRGNRGGYMRIFKDIAKYFCKNATDENPVVAIADNDDGREAYYATDNLYAEYFAQDSRITVLADANTASASECLLGCMLDYGTIDYDDICLTRVADGTAKTYGKGIMQTTYPFWGGAQGAIKLTTAHILWPQGNCLHGRGITDEDGTKTVEEDVDFERLTAAAIETLYAE